MRKKTKNFRIAISSLLICGILFTQPAIVFGTANTTPDPTVSDPTPTPDPHTTYYYQEAESDQITGWPKGPSIEAEAAIVMEMNTGTILYAKNADKKMYPASITKIMTALLASENLNMSDSFSMSYSAAFGIEAGSSSIYGDTDEIFTVEQAMMGLMLASANEMALMLGELTAGSTKKFVELMNERARVLGCTNTHFNNPNGLPDETHYTTARDMALIAKAAFLNPLCREFMCTLYYEIPPTNKQADTRYLTNHHKMMKGLQYAYDGVLGGKNGYTIVAGNTLVTYAERGNMKLLTVVLQSVGGAYADTAALLDYGFDQFEVADMGWNIHPKLAIFPSEKHILNPENTDTAFYSVQDAQVCVPVGTDITTLCSSSELLPSYAGGTRMKTTYYYEDYPVGYGIRYEKEILPDLLP